MIGLNMSIPVSMAFHDLGNHHMHGPSGVRFYTKQKMVTSRWPTGIRAEAEYVIPTIR